MKRIIATSILGCLLLGAGVVNAGPIAKFTFEGVEFSDGSYGTIRAGTKQVKKSGYTVCDYYTLTDAYLGKWEEAVFVEAGDVEQYCLDHFEDRS